MGWIHPIRKVTKMTDTIKKEIGIIIISKESFISSVIANKIKAADEMLETLMTENEDVLRRLKDDTQTY
jgi:hypothetical protein